MAQLIAPTQDAITTPAGLTIAAGATAIVGLICADFPALNAPSAQYDSVKCNIVGAPSTATPALTLDRDQHIRVIPNPTSEAIVVQFTKPATMVAIGVFQKGGTAA